MKYRDKFPEPSKFRDNYQRNLQNDHLPSKNLFNNIEKPREIPYNPEDYKQELEEEK